jgi:hypothetical protein
MRKLLIIMLIISQQLNAQNNITIFNSQGVIFNGVQLYFTDSREDIINKIGPSTEMVEARGAGGGDTRFLAYKKDGFTIRFFHSLTGVNSFSSEFDFISSPGPLGIMQRQIKIEGFDFIITETTTQAELIAFAERNNLSWNRIGDISIFSLFNSSIQFNTTDGYGENSMILNIKISEATYIQALLNIHDVRGNWHDTSSVIIALSILQLLN